MAIAEIELEDGRIVELEVQDGVTEQEIRSFLAQNPQMLEQARAPDPQALPQRESDPLASVVEPVLAVATGAVAEPIAGLAGIAQSLNPFAERGAGARAVEATREALTFQPRTQAGQEGLQAVGEFVQPAAEALEASEEFLGQSVLDATGSPALAAAAATAPTAVIEALSAGVGGKVAKGTARAAPKKSAVRSMLSQAAPEPERLKDLARGIYGELDSSGVQLKPKTYARMVRKIENAAKSQGLSKRTTKKAFGAIKDFKDELGKPVSTTQVDDLRKVAQGVAGSLDGTEKAIGARIVNEIDDFLDNVKPDNLVVPEGAATDVGSKYRAARNLWGRAKKSELVTDAIKNAKGRASGFENGIRIKLAELAKNKRTKKFFSKDELQAIKDIEAGNFSQNFSKFLGRFAFNEGRANNILSALAGVGGGAAVGGPFGAIAVPVIGQTSRQIAKNLTKGRAEFLDSIIRAGKSGEAITEAYLTAVPKGKRSVVQLTELLSDPSVDLEPLFRSSNQTIKKAAEIAAGRQIIGQAAGALAPTVTTQEGE